MYIAGMITDQVDTAAIHKVGSVGTDGSGNKWKYVKLLNVTATVAGLAGDVAGYSLGLSGSHTVVLDNTDAATKPVGAGVLNATVTGTLAVPYYLWIQVTGPVTALKNLAGTPADGDALFLSTTDKTLTLATAADDPICAYADDDSAQLIHCAFAH